LRFTPRGAGFELRGWFDQECTAILRTAISPLAAPTDAHQAAAHQAAAHQAGACEERGCDHETPQNLRPQNLSPIGGPRRSGTGTRSSSWPGG
jgi:hypothetical protein